MEGLRTDLGMGVLSGSQTDVPKASSDMGGKITALDKAIKEIQATNNERRKIVSDLQAAMRLHKGTFYREPDIASADKTVKATDKLYSQYRQLLDIVDQEQDRYDKYLAG